MGARGRMRIATYVRQEDEVLQFRFKPAEKTEYYAQKSHRVFQVVT